MGLELGKDWQKSSLSFANQNCIEVRWARSSWCAHGDCIEVASGTIVLVRDSMDPQGPQLQVSTHNWRSFTAAIRAA